MNRLLPAGALFALLVLTAGSAALAQPGRGDFGDPAERRALRLEQLTERLNLDKGQQARLDSILTVQDDEMMAMREKARGQGDFQALRSAMTTLREKTDLQVLSILSAEQGKAYQAFRKEEDEARRSRGGRRGANP